MLRAFAHGGLTRLALTVGVILMLALSLRVGPVSAATVTVGESDLIANAGTTDAIGEGIPVFQGDAGGNYVLASPVAGTLVSWSFLSGGAQTGSQYVLRVLRPDDSSGANWRAVGTSAVATVTSAGSTDAVNGPFTTSLAVAAGDRVALQPVNGTTGTPQEAGTVGQDGIRYFPGAVQDGSSAAIAPGSSADNGQVVPIQAAVQPATPPSVSSSTPSTPPPAPAPPSPRLMTRSLGGQLALDGSGTRGGGATITGYRFQLHGAVGAQISCGPNSPVAVPVFSRPTSDTATLTAITAAGSVATSAVTFRAPGVAPLTRGVHRSHLRQTLTGRARAARIADRLIAYQCVPAAGTHPRVFVPESGAARISSACELDAGVLRVQGCGLAPASALCSGVPGPERHAIEGHMLVQAAVKGLAVGPCADRLTTKLLASLASVSTIPAAALKDYENVSDQFYVSTTPVRVNGLDLLPSHGGAIVIATGGRFSTAFARDSAYLVSSDAIVKVGGFPLPVSNHLDLDVSSTTALHADTACAGGPTAMDLPLGEFALKNAIELPTFLRVINSQNPGTPLASLPELPVTGSLTVGLGAGGSSYLAVNIALNRVLDDPQDPDGNFTGCTVLDADNAHGVDVKHFEINAPNVDIGVPAQFKFIYDRPTRSFSGSLALEPPGASGQIGGSIDFLDGVFADAGLNFTADPGGGYPVGAGFYLVRIDGKFYLFQHAIPGSHTALQGDMRVSYGPAVDNNGCGLLDGEGKARIVFYPGPFSLDAEFATELYCYPVTSRYFHVDGAGNVELGIDTGFTVGPVGFNVNADGQAFYDGSGTPRVQLDASGDGHIDFPDPIGTQSIHVDGSISDRGAGFCASIDGFELGAGESFIPPPVNQLVFLHNLSFMWDGCDLSSFRSLAAGGPPAGLARPAATASYRFSVPTGSRPAVLALEGTDGSPSVSLHGPGGRVLDTASDSVSRSALVLRQPATGVTLVELAGRRTGDWTLTPDPGSPAIRLARVARVLAPPQIKASVTGTGSRRVLHYAIVSRPGMRVSFLERGDNGSSPIGRAKLGRGAIPFTPSAARPGRRLIIAEITQNGQPAPALTVARYRGSAPRAGRASRITVRRRRGGLLISFRAAPRATAQLLALDLSDGRGLRIGAAGNATRIFVARVSARTRLVDLSIYGVRDGVRGLRAGPGRR
jgi:hypothetical protein